MSFSDYCEAALLNSLFGKTSNFGALASAPSLYVALLTAAPSDSDDGTTITEADYTGYSRVSTAATDWNASSGTSPSTIDNANEIAFGQKTGGTDDTVTHVALVDAATGGNLIAHAALGASKTIQDNDTPKFAAGELNFTLD